MMTKSESRRVGRVLNTAIVWSGIAAETHTTMQRELESENADNAHILASMAEQNRIAHEALSTVRKTRDDYDDFGNN